MGKCKECGASSDHVSGIFGVCGLAYRESCLRRQLAAANERAGRLEAQMVELREGWPSFEYVDDTEGMVAIEVPEVVIQNFHRILGGA